MAIPRLSPSALEVLDGLLWELRGWQTSSAIAEAVGRPIGQVIPVLADLERSDWLASTWFDPDPALHGRPQRRVYRFTPDGEQWARHALAGRRLDRHDTEPMPAEHWTGYRVDDLLLAAITRLLPEHSRERYDQELAAELAASRHPIGDAISMLGNVAALRHALVVAGQHRPLKCRLHRHDERRVITDPANHLAYYLRCRRCGRERHPGSAPELQGEERAAWAPGAGVAH